VILDTSVVVAFTNRTDRRHDEVASWLEGHRGPLVTSPLAVAGANAIFAFSSR
jgi:predicted nucleic acid-binding protein